MQTLRSVANVDVCGRLLLLAPGGPIAYFGPPAEALQYFGRHDFVDLFLLTVRPAIQRRTPRRP